MTIEASATAMPPAPAPPPKKRLDKLPASFLGTLAEQHYRQWLVNLRDAPPYGAFDLREVTVADLFDPVFWAHHIGATKLNRFDIVRVVGGREGTSSTFDILLTVVTKTGLGAIMKPYAYVSPGSALADELDIVAAGNGVGDLRQKIADMKSGASLLNEGRA